MNKKLLFGIMSLAALTACTSDDFESQEVAQKVSPIQFEVINGLDDAFTRASMDGNKIVWNANEGDLFTLYHGAALDALTGYENATYTAKNGVNGAPASLTTPSMIKAGGAVMVWPVDTAFRIRPANALSIVIPEVLKAKTMQNPKGGIENQIPYVSDVINIGGYNAGAPYNTEGLNRPYPIYMRPMASQLTIKADYVGSDNKIAELYEGGADGLTGDDAIDKITLSSVNFLTAAGSEFTKEIPIQFTAANASWPSAASIHHNWYKVTDFNIGGIVAAGQTTQLTTEVITGTESCKLLMLPQANISGGLTKGAVVVNTRYGKVFIGDPTDYTTLPNKTYYTNDEFKSAWYRYVSAAVAAPTTEENASTPGTGEYAGKHKVVAKNLELGMQQTINMFSTATSTDATVLGEHIGAATTRFVEVRLTHLDMSDLHVKTDKQLRDAAKVWNKMGLTDVTVYLDGDDNKEFKISQKTIETINNINNGTLKFQVQPCNIASEKCETIVITGGGDVQDIAFITYNDINGNDAFDLGTDINVKVAFANEATKWKWNGTTDTKKTIKVQADGVSQIINRGTMLNDFAGTATLATFENDGTQNNVPLKNEGTWEIKTGTKLNVQFDVTNIGTINIDPDAQYRMDGLTQDVKFDNEAETLPQRILDKVAPGTTEKLGKVYNAGVFATVAAAGNSADINNYGLIEHLSLAAKTYITTNQKGGNFSTAFNNSTNKMGMINFGWDCKAAENVSISNALNTGFVAVTVNGEVSGKLNASTVGSKVNYVIIKNGVTEINQVAGSVKYLEINETGTEIVWKTTETNSYTGLTVLSDVNITQGTTVKVTGAVFLGADMYVGGEFNNGTLGVLPSWNGYYGNTTSKFASNYITY